MIYLNNMEKYMLTMNNIYLLLPSKISTLSSNKLNDGIYKKSLKVQDTKTQNVKTQDIKTQNVKTQEEKKLNHDINDPLFWIFYCILYGDIQYEFNYSFQEEKTFKIKSIEELRKIKVSLKTYKLKLNEIEDQLLNQKKISIQGLLGLALLYKKNILYIWDNKFFEFICSEESPIYIIKNNKNEKVSYEEDTTQVQYYKDTYLPIENINNCLKAITNYSKDELITISHKLKIMDINPKSTKAILYQKILEKI